MIDFEKVKKSLNDRYARVVVGHWQNIYSSPLKTKKIAEKGNDKTMQGTVSKINLRHLKADMTFGEKP